MKQLVEDAGGELSAGYIYKRFRWFGQSSGQQTLGGQAVAWEFSSGGIVVSHPSEGPRSTSDEYLVTSASTL